MRAAIVTILLMAIWQDGLQAQTVIGGSVLNAQGKPIEAYVSVTDKKTGSILAYSDVDNKGNYKLSFETDADSVVVTASGLTIGNHPKTVPNCSQQISFRPKEEILQLQEVMVKAKKIRQDGDTLSYNVASYSQQGDRVIADVLKRMPGIEVSGDGGIKFNGKGISKFYVEGMDLLQGRYGIATNNVNAQDVASVQVLQNHQPVKALRGKMLTDDVAMNLKLKSSSKGTLGVNAMVGGGIEGENKGPLQVDMTKISAAAGLARTTLLSYLQILHRSRLLNLLFSGEDSVKKMQKPDKIYLENPNLIDVLSLTGGNTGTIRESFVVNQLAYQHLVEYTKAGDLIIDKTYTIEIGGKSKDGKQIANVPHSFIAADDTEYAFGNKIPLWAFGCLY